MNDADQPILALLFVCQDPTRLRRIDARLVRAGGYDVTVAPDAGASRLLLDIHPFDVALVDLVPSSSREPATLAGLRQALGDMPTVAILPEGSSFITQAAALVQDGVEDVIAEESAGATMLDRVLRLAVIRGRRQLMALRFAYEDAETGTGNRRLLKDRMMRARERVRRSGTPLAIVGVRLDRIEEAKGAAQRIALLRAAAARITARVRRSDTVVRWGEQAFAVLLEDLRDGQAGEVVAENLMAALRRPFKLGGLRLAPRVTIGVVIWYPGRPFAPELDAVLDEVLAEAAALGGDRWLVRDLGADYAAEPSSGSGPVVASRSSPSR